MYSELGVGLSALIIVWLGVLTFFVWQERGFLNKLFPFSGERDIRHKLEELLKIVESFDKELKVSNQRLEVIEKEGLLHLKKVKLLRYNPFNDTGGDQSFVVVLLNDNGDGLVITSLHARVGTRIFAKSVKGGKAEKYELSKEEQELINSAIKT